MGVAVKICGINSLEGADAAIRAGADFAGLNHVPRSPRFLNPEQARALASHMRGRIRLVAVLCDPDDGDVARIIEQVRPDLLQLHGSESPERIASLKGRYGLGVIKAVQVAGA
ncbi:MAG: phosphoribosylanthranilate isomerase, partial [Alphaproteobacteria bacterium]|nr:phosphoribosylanthranilate isomerase [Alphaproteobacteria bacterium]